MKFPAKVRYAFRAALALAAHYKGEHPVRVGQIAKAQDIPQNFLLQLMMRLKGAGIVQSARGMNGGYFLARPPARITLGEIMRAVDESLFSPNKTMRAQDAAGSVLLRIWNEANAAASELLEQQTLEDVLLRCKREPINYQI
jgi:Rrf2 family protein